MGLAGRYNAIPRVRETIKAAINRVGPGKGINRVFLCLHPRFDLRSRQIRPAIMQPTGRKREIWPHKMPVGRQVKRHAGLNRFGNGLEPDPHPEKRLSA